jgi:hypothetical protein
MNSPTATILQESFPHSHMCWRLGILPQEQSTYLKQQSRELLGFWALSIIWNSKTRKHNILEWLRLALSKGPNWVSSSHHPRTETDPEAEETLFSSLLDSGQWTKSRTPVIMKVIHHHQSPFDSISNQEAYYATAMSQLLKVLSYVNSHWCCIIFSTSRFL